MIRGPAIAAALVVGCGGTAGGTPPVVIVPAQPPAAASGPAPQAIDPPPTDVAVAVDPNALPLPFEGPNGKGGKTPRLRDLAPRPLKVKWSTRVGKTTFRTTMALVDSSLIIGTHGDTLKGMNEASDGVYVLEAATGKVTRKIPTPGAGDKDVGGIAVDGAHVVFTTDNGQVVKARHGDGAIVWTKKLKGKVRPAPALGDLDGKGARDVVVGDESGALHALSGDDGSVIWKRQTGKNSYDAEGFIAAAAIGDIDRDGKDDVVAGARDGALVAYRGADGSELWRENEESGIHASPSLVDLDGDKRLEVVAAWAYSRFVILDGPTGKVRYVQEVEQDNVGIEGLFATPVPLPRKGKPGLFVTPTSWWGGKHGQANGGTVDGVVLLGQSRREHRTDEGRTTASAVVLDLDDRGTWQAVLGTEAGELLALDPLSGTRTVLAKLAGGIEASALVADVDKDGKYELIVASNDGNLTCFATGSTTKPLVSRFRGESADNRGNLGAVDLGWTKSARADDPDTDFDD